MMYLQKYEPCWCNYFYFKIDTSTLQLWFNINVINSACGINCGKGSDINTLILVLVYYIFVIMAFDYDIIMYQ